MGSASNGMSFKKLLKFLNPAPAVGALEITDSTLRFLRIDNGNLVKASLGLPPGIIEDGKIKDRPNFVAALKNLHHQIASVKKKTPIIISISANNVYSQVFTIPFLSEKRLEDAAKLNLQMISPTEIKDAYYDWQIVGETSAEGGQLEILGAFVNSSLVDELSNALSETDFEVVGAEFSSLALARTVKEVGAGADFNRACILLDISGDGLNFMILRNGNLYFNYFHSWRSLAAGKENEPVNGVSVAILEEFIQREIQRLVSFFSTHWSGKIEEVVLVSESLKAEIAKLIQEKLSLKVRELALKEYSGLTANWFGILGAALRGQIPRSQDKFISLAAAGTEERYYRWQILNFIRIWRNAILASLGFIFLVFMIVDSFLARNLSSLNRKLSLNLALPAVSEINFLRDQAKEFNRLVDLASKANEKSTKRSPLFETLSVLAGRAITLERVYADYSNNSVFINGTASNETAAINFKNRLASEPNFSEVFLPLASIETNRDGTVAFQVSFKMGGER